MTRFSDLKLDPKVLKAVAEAGYTEPTPIQAQAIPPALEGRDVLGIAQTGTGKTAGFTLPMITLLGRGRARARMPRSLILCPTRELAAQVAENFDLYAKHTRLSRALLIGGVSFNEQDKLIDRGVDVLIATPGRLLDHFERGKLLLTGVQIMVVDEADRMLDMGFIPDIEHIFQLTPFTRQTLFFSATMAPEIERITDTFLHSPERIEIARQATASETIDQRLIEITPTRKDQTARQKREVLRAVIEAEGKALTNAIIFCNRKTDVDVVSKSLKAHGYDAAPIHGDLDQRVRTATLDGFRDGNLRFLVASDVAARGLDIPAVSHVFNFDLPNHAEDYVHRIGRTGRAGREGIAISLSVPADEKNLAAIETLLKRDLPRASLPKGFSLSEAGPGQAAAPAGRRDGGRAASEGRGRGSRSGARRDDTRGEARGEARGDGGRKRHGHAHDAGSPRTADGRTGGRESGATPATATAAAQAERPAERHDAGSRREGGAGRHDHGRSDHGRNDQGRGGRGHTRHDHRDADGRKREGGRVLGLGDVVPEFMTRSFRLEDLATSPLQKPQPADESDHESAAQEAAAREARTHEAEAPKQRSSRRSRRPKSSAPAEAQPAERPAEAAAPDTAPASAVPEAAAETTVPEAAAKAAAPEQARPASSTAEVAGADRAEVAPAEATPETPAAAPSESEAAMPEAPVAEADAAEAPKPRTTRRRASRSKTAIATEDEPAAEKTEAAAPAKAPVRRKKASTAKAAAKPESEAVAEAAPDAAAKPESDAEAAAATDAKPVRRTRKPRAKPAATADSEGDGTNTGATATKATKTSKAEAKEAKVKPAAKPATRRRKTAAKDAPAPAEAAPAPDAAGSETAGNDASGGGVPGSDVPANDASGNAPAS